MPHAEKHRRHETSQGWPSECSPTLQIPDWPSTIRQGWGRILRNPRHIQNDLGNMWSNMRNVWRNSRHVRRDVRWTSSNRLHMRSRPRNMWSNLRHMRRESLHMQSNMRNMWSKHLHMWNNHLHMRINFRHMWRESRWMWKRSRMRSQKSNAARRTPSGTLFKNIGKTLPQKTSAALDRHPRPI